MSRTEDPRHTKQMSAASVLVVEDDQFSRTLLCTALSAAGIAVLSASGRASVALAAARKVSPDVALLDLDLGPGPTGFELAIVLRREFPRIGIVILTSYLDPRLVGVEPGMIPPGAHFLRKSGLEDTTALVRTILQAQLKPVAVQRYRFASSPKLTPKQLLVLTLVAEGRATKEIARELGVSDKAVEASISRLHRALDITSAGATSSRISLVRAFYAMTGRGAPRG